MNASESGPTWVKEMNAKRIVVVAHRTAATPRLIEAVRSRAARGPCAFTLLVPELRETHAPEEADLMLELALPLLEEAAGGEVEGRKGASDPYQAVEQLHRQSRVDEIIVSTLPEHVSHWLRRDLPSKLEGLGVPVTVVTAKAGDPRRSRTGRFAATVASR
jgi:hypothetical protein